MPELITVPRRVVTSAELHGVELGSVVGFQPVRPTLSCFSTLPARSLDLQHLFLWMSDSGSDSLFFAADCKIWSFSVGGEVTVDVVTGKRRLEVPRLAARGCAFGIEMSCLS